MNPIGASSWLMANPSVTVSFFPPAALDACLKLRSWLDTIGCEDPEAASVATVAAVAALVPCSNMIRRGDLRFRKGAEREGIVGDLTGEARDRLRAIARDITNLQSVDHAPVLIAGDAKRLSHIPGLEVDATVTSPPYLNGTNYYRNTKIELWFLRALSSAGDLTTQVSGFRMTENRFITYITRIRAAW